MNEPDGAWIFLSHSTKDWNEVRRVRNLLEDRGHRPLVFFLKCLTEHSELDELIRREIDARSWFLLCESENAQKSSWVQAEVAYIKEQEGKYYEEIDLNDAIETQIERIDRLCRRVTVFLSYLHKDELFARRIREALVEHDYSVWDAKEEVKSGGRYVQAIEQAIDSVVERGFFLIFLSPDSVQSKYVRAEIEYALKKASKATHSANIIPIVIRDPRATQASLPREYRRMLAGIQWFDFSQGDFRVKMENLISHMKSRPMD